MNRKRCLAALAAQGLKRAPMGKLKLKGATTMILSNMLRGSADSVKQSQQSS